MSRPFHDLYASPALLDLRREQDRALEPLLRRCAGEHALLLDVAAGDRTIALPLLAGWTRLHWHGGDWCGDVLARGDEPLPFRDDSLDLVLVRHALEQTPKRVELLRDIARVLAPGGMLAIAGIHALSGWAPWVHWKARGSKLALIAPDDLARALRRQGIETSRMLRIGGLWPGRPSSPRASPLFGGGYVLLAGKPRQVTVATRLQPRWAAPPTPVQLVPGARRHSA